MKKTIVLEKAAKIGMSKSFGIPRIYKKVLENWDGFELDAPVIKRKEAIQKALKENKHYCDIYVTLAFLTEAFKITKYLEVGTRQGASLVQAFSPRLKLAWCVDRWEKYVDLDNNVDKLYDRLKDCFRRRSINTYLELFKGESTHIFPLILQRNVKFDLITIDGDHSAKGAAQDLDYALEALENDGMIVFDDICNANSSWLMSVMQNFVYANELKVIYTTDGNGTAVIWRP